MRTFENYLGLCVIDIDDNFRVESIYRILSNLFLNIDSVHSEQEAINELLTCSQELKLSLLSSCVDKHFSLPLTLKLKTSETITLHVKGYCELDSITQHRFVNLSFYKYFPNALSLKNENYDQAFIASLISSLSNKSFEKTIQQILEIVADYFELDNVCVDTLLKQSFVHRACDFFTYNSVTKCFKRDMIKITKTHSFAFDHENIKEMPKVAVYTNQKNNSNPFFIKCHNKYRINSIASFFNESSDINCYMVSFLRKRDLNFTEYELNTLERATTLLCTVFDFHRRTIRYNRRIEELLSKDNTTDTYVFESFLKLSNEVISAKKDGQFAFISFDINHFSYIVTHCSEQESADVLCDLVGKFRKLNRNILISRLYGDNFMAMFQIKTKSDLHDKLNSLINGFNSKMETLYPNIDISLSLGVYISDASEKNIKKCTENASYIHKTHKKNVKNSINYFTKADELERQDEEEISSSFKSSLLKGEYKLYLQPKYNLLTKQVIGAEALSRLETQQGVILPPYRFIPILEKTGYLPQLDLFIFNEVARTLKHWLENNYQIFPISINFSKQHILSPNFVSSLITIAKQYDVPLHYFDVEITETTIASNQDYIKDCIEKLTQCGFKVSMDDFGTGYSSLNMLLGTKINTVKIDKEFVDETGVSKQKNGYLTRVAELINFAGKDVIVEGVESAVQAQFLLKNNILNIQGYYVSKPLPLLDFEIGFVMKKQ